VKDQYEDIMYLPHHVSRSRPQMPVGARAAQFAPFAALTGYDAAVKETRRVTQVRGELDEGAKAEIDAQLCFLAECDHEKRRVTVTYFEPDKRKTGGAYITVTERIRKIDAFNQVVHMQNGLQIPIHEIFSLELN